MGLSHQWQVEGERIVSKFPSEHQWSSRTWAKDIESVGELRLGSVAFEWKVEVWSEKKSEMLVPEVKEVDTITWEECMEEEDERTRAGTLR